MFTSSIPKKRSHLTLNIPQQSYTNKEPAKASTPTPTNELASHRVKQAFTTPYTADEFIDRKGNIGIEYSNRYLLKLQQPITPGAHANVQQAQLISPGGNSAIELVRKKGESTVRSEIEIYHLIATNPRSSEKAILQYLYSEKNLYENILHFPLMQGGDLKKRQNYLFNTLNDINKRSASILWLYKQLISLLEALHHLHTEEFFLKNKKCKGIIHGDIKPDNILINSAGDLLLADFGCAYPARKPAKQLGSIRYCAPEIFSNENFQKNPVKNIEKSDIWSLGITLYYLLMNKFPCLTNEFSEKKNSQIKNNYLTNGYVVLPKKYLKKSQALFFKEGIDGYFYRKKWGENFSHSVLAKQAREAIERLNNNNYYLVTDLNQRRISILYDITLSMLSPIETRPSATALLKRLKKLAPPAKDYSTPTYNAFISDLLAQSPLNKSVSNRLALPAL